MKRAIIDIGSNSVRLMLADMDGTRFIRKEKYLTTTRIAEGLAATGELSPAAMERTRSAVDAYRQQALQWGAERAYCYATSAVREAANGAAFIASLAKPGRLEAEIITGRQEAEIAYQGAETALPESKNALVLDVGGGSTELISMQNGQVRACSVRMGCVVCKERFLHADPITPEDARALDAFCVEQAAVLAEHARGGGIYGATCGTLKGVGGSATQLAMLALALPEYDGNAVNGYYMATEEVEALYEKMKPMTAGERKKLTGMAAARADIIPVGAAIILAVLRACKADGMHTSDGDGLEGYALGLVERL